MTDTPTAELERQAALIRASGTLGKPGPVLRLFEFLLQRSLAGSAPKELEIAVAVFGKSASFDVSQDSLVRVYVHKLRRRLEDFYARQPNATRLVIRKGQYRLGVESTQQAPEPVILPEPAPVAAASVQRAWRPRVALACAVLLSALAGALATFMLLPKADAELRALRHSTIWAPLLADDLPITLVLGDYYMLGESDGAGQVQRLVREFFINSGGDLLHQLEVNPEHVQRYRDLNLTYLPTASAFALQDLVPVLAAKQDVRVIMMSDLTGATLKNTHVVYVGYISGLGMLGDAVFAGSRLSPGGSFDELVDAATQATYVSSAVGNGDADRYTDYGYFSSFPGPNHNRIVIVAGTRDPGVTQTAEAVTRVASVAQIARQAGNATAFESLFEVHGVAKASLDAKLVFVSGLKSTRFWDGE